MKRMPSLAAVFVLSLICIASSARAAHVGAAMTDAANQFLATCDEKARAKATMDFDNPKRMDWHNIPKADRKGLPLMEMTSEQRQKCDALLHIALSESGYAKAQNIFALENNVREGEKGKPIAALRGSGRYYLMIFGEPKNTGTWGWSFEGHHLSLNFVIKDGQVIADTPSFWGAHPATVHVVIKDGPKEGVRTLAEEEQSGIDLMQMLTPEQQKKATIAAKAPADYRAAGKPQPPQDPPAGISATELNDEQKKALFHICEAYESHLTDEIRDADLAQIKSDGIDQAFFAWAGPADPAKPHYFRVQGPSFLLELDNFQTDLWGLPANHIHSVWRNPKGDFAVPIKTAAAH